MNTNNTDFFVDEVLEEAPRFGLIEDHNGSPCRCSEVEEDQWNAEINNPSKCRLYFNPIDKHLEVSAKFTDNGQDKKKCDAMLHSSTTLLFIELKDIKKVRDRKKARRKAVEQLLSTVSRYQSSSFRRSFPEQYAAICFRRPQVSLNVNVSSAASKEQLNEMGFALVSGYRIIFDEEGRIQMKESADDQ